MLSSSLHHTNSVAAIVLPLQYTGGGTAAPARIPRSASVDPSLRTARQPCGYASAFNGACFGSTPPHASPPLSTAMAPPIDHAVSGLGVVKPRVSVPFTPERSTSTTDGAHSTVSSDTNMQFPVHPESASTSRATAKFQAQVPAVGSGMGGWRGSGSLPVKAGNLHYDQAVADWSERVKQYVFELPRRDVQRELER